MNGFKDDGKYAVWIARELRGRGLDIATVTNNKREAISIGKQAIAEGWKHVLVQENKYAGYPRKTFLSYGEGNFVTG